MVLKNPITILHKNMTFFCMTLELSLKITDLRYSKSVLSNFSHMRFVHSLLSI